MFAFLHHCTSVKTVSPQKVFFTLPGENRQFRYQFYYFVAFPFNYGAQRKLDIVFTFNYEDDKEPESGQEGVGYE